MSGPLLGTIDSTDPGGTVADVNRSTSANNELSPAVTASRLSMRSWMASIRVASEPMAAISRVKVVMRLSMEPRLATTGSTAPFIGLFGTVWGIMRAFAGLGTLGEEGNLLTSVTPHIAEALVATAIGLVAAIPAVMAYNYFVNRIKVAVGDMEGFGSDYLNALRRLFISQPK